MKLAVWVGLLLAMASTVEARGPKVVAEAHYYGVGHVADTLLYTPRRAGLYRMYVNVTGALCPVTNVVDGGLQVFGLPDYGPPSAPSGLTFNANPNQENTYSPVGWQSAAYPSQFIFHVSPGASPIRYQSYRVSEVECPDWVFRKIDLVLEQIAEFPREPVTPTTTTVTTTLP